MAPRICFYGDDATGAADSLWNFTRCGLNAVLLTGVPRGREVAVAEAYDVVGVAGVARALPTKEIEAEVRPALEWFLELGVGAVQYKVCSTFDSSEWTGSIGRAVEVLIDVFGSQVVPVLPAQPEYGRYTVFSNHFARFGGEFFRLDRHPIMSVHPTTPMGEADLVRHLSRQTRLPVSAVHLPELNAPGAGLEGWHERAQRANGRGLVVIDALTDDDIAQAARAILRLGPVPVRACVGSGGLSWGLAKALLKASVRPGRRAACGDGEQEIVGQRGVLALSGSCSSHTWRQIEVASRHGWATVRLSAGAGNMPDMSKVLRQLETGHNVVCYTAAGPKRLVNGGVSAQSLGERFSAMIVKAQKAVGTKRVVVCGGDTSSYTVRGLGHVMLQVKGMAEQSVPVLEVEGPEGFKGLELVLKGGQMGTTNLFAKLGASPPGM